MGCGASTATNSVPAVATTVERPAAPPQLPRGCGISDWQQRQPTCVGRVQSALASIAQANDDLHACIEVLGEDALRMAEAADAKLASGAAPRALEGVPLLVKCNIDLAGSLSTAGTAGLADWRPSSDAAIVAKLLEHGAICVAKTNMPELALGWWGYNKLHGTCRNPLDPGATSGGSSAGTASGIAASMAPIGLGSDTMGSLRTPSECCGISGFRPSHGRYPTAGVVPLSTTEDTPGPMGKTVADVAVLDALIVGEPLSSVVPAQLRGLTFCVPSDWIEELDPGSRAALDAAVEAVTAAGATVRKDLAFKPVTEYSTDAKVNFSEIEMQKYIDSHPGLTTTVDELLDQCDNPMLRPSYKEGGPGWAKINMATKTAEEAENLRTSWERERDSIEAAYAEFFKSNGVDALLTPVHPIAPVRIEGAWEEDASYNEKGGFAPIFHWMPMAKYVKKFNEIRAPSVVVPTPARHPLVSSSGHAEGLPAGVLVWGPPNSDSTVLRLGMALEQELVLGAEDEVRR